MRKILILLLTLYAVSPLQAQLKTYPNTLNTGMKHNDDYTVCVRMPGGEWQDLFEYNVQVDMDNVRNASMVQFDMGSPVEVMVKKNNGTIYDVAIRPLAKGIKHIVNRNVITFTLDKPQYLSIEFNGDRLHNLHLFANPLETETYTQAAKGVMYFGPGVHRPKDLPNNQIQVSSNTTVYLAPGAVLKAKLLVDKAENVRIIGRGILDHPVRGIEVTYSKNVWIDGITVVNPDHYTVFGGETDGLTVKNLKSFSCKGWSDGIDLMSCRNVMIDNVFMRNSDDCIALYAHRWNFWGDTQHVVLQNAILWADIAHPINIGGHGNSEGQPGDRVGNITVRNVDILEHDEDDIPYQGCMAIDAGDKNLVHDVLFEDIRVESIQEGRLFHINVRFNAKYDKEPGRGVENITFRNISYDGVGEKPSLIKGYDATRSVKNVTFENIIINGQKMKDSKGFQTNEFIEDIKVK
ncbi:glycosyl hydrolase family 28 protein [Bacteroides sp. 51]|uniref:glycosyl hydrolase family 28 protein n=1 Tax=Bacteroides sp. 51 TaxID=2302938 RepID=UPI0013D067E9|nr:glycosyl hydrolase family 28 protein [Bacteroides sp. 51]NDV83658.1 glycoside hydrolase [Bacteroides sp. 51]